MILLLLAYLGGVLTSVSPRILPVLPFVFARPCRPFLRSALPMLAGMALTIGGAEAVLNGKDGDIVYRFHARDLHLVLGATHDGKPIRFHVTLDGAAPGDSHGADVDETGQGVVTGQRLDQLVRQSVAITDRTFEIHVLDPCVEAHAFTFG
jgi:hypothetical protein